MEITIFIIIETFHLSSLPHSVQNTPTFSVVLGPVGVEMTLRYPRGSTVALEALDAITGALA